MSIGTIIDLILLIVIIAYIAFLVFLIMGIPYGFYHKYPNEFEQFDLPSISEDSKSSDEDSDENQSDVQ